MLRYNSICPTRINVAATMNGWLVFGISETSSSSILEVNNGLNGVELILSSSQYKEGITDDIIFFFFYNWLCIDIYIVIIDDMETYYMLFFDKHHRCKQRHPQIPQIIIYYFNLLEKQHQGIHSSQSPKLPRHFHHDVLFLRRFVTFVKDFLEAPDICVSKFYFLRTDWGVDFFTPLKAPFKEKLIFYWN